MMRLSFYPFAWLVAWLAIAAVGWAEPAAMAGVGKLDLRGKAACTGALIAPDLVLTAGHCLKAFDGEQSFAAKDISFRPGRSPGQPRPEPIKGALVAVHPIWGFGVGPKGVRVAFDLGLLRLQTPVASNVAQPLGFGGLPDVSERLLIAGYRGGKGEVARQRRCAVIEANHAVTGLGCPVDFGESGSPMMRLENGVPVIVGVLSNKGLIDGQLVGFGPVTATGLDTVVVHLQELEALKASDNN
ncbi:MAG: trypsin-like serine protease [Pseudomonadota bacterium]